MSQLCKVLLYPTLYIHTLPAQLLFANKRDAISPKFFSCVGLLCIWRQSAGFRKILGGTWPHHQTSMTHALDT